MGPMWFYRNSYCIPLCALLIRHWKRNWIKFCFFFFFYNYLPLFTILESNSCVYCNCNVKCTCCDQNNIILKLKTRRNNENPFNIFIYFPFDFMGRTTIEYVEKICHTVVEKHFFYSSNFSCTRISTFLFWTLSFKILLENKCK